MARPGRRDARARAARAALLSLALAPLAGPSLDAAAAQRPRKSAQDCNDELRDKAAAIAAAGMSASAFFHSCWWDTPPGLPTPIVADERAKRHFEAQPSKTKVFEIRAIMTRPVATRLSRWRRPPRRDRAAPSLDEPIAVPEAATAPAVPAVAASAVAGTAPPYPEAAGLPGRVTVGVPAVGQLSLPVLPGLAPAVRAVVDHPLVPGLVTADP